MVSLDQLFTNIKSNVESETEARFCCILLKNVKDPFDVKGAFPEAISYTKEKSTKQGSTIRVTFKTPLQAEEAATTQLDSITITLPTRGSKRKHESIAKAHPWKIMRDVKVQFRRCIKMLKEDAKNEPEHAAAFERETSLMQSVLRFLHDHKIRTVIKDNADFFRLYDDGEEVPYIKTFRVKVQTEIQNKISALEKYIRQSKNDSAMKKALNKRRNDLTSCQLMLQLLKGHQDIELIKPIKPSLSSDDIKEEEQSDEDAVSSDEDNDESGEQPSDEEEDDDESEVEEEAPEPPKRPRGPAKKQRYFDLK